MSDGEGQIHARAPQEQAPQEQAPQAPANAKQAQAIDDVLDQIDSALERNAQSFVEGFVQKGGQ